MSDIKNTFLSILLLRFKIYLRQFVDFLCFCFDSFRFIRFGRQINGSSLKRVQKQRKKGLKTELCVNISRQNAIFFLFVRSSMYTEHRTLCTKHVWDNVVFI